MRAIFILALLLLAAVRAEAQPVGVFSQGASGCSTPLDSVSQTFPFAGGVRKLRSAYAGKALNLDLSSVATDIGFSGCDLDTSSLSGCTSAGTCPINTIYDQSGNGANCTQTGTNRPSLLINIQNGHPAIHFVAANTQSCAGTLASSVGSAQIFVAGNTDSAGNRGYFSWGSGATGQTLWYSTSLGDCTMTNNGSVNVTTGVGFCNEWGRLVGDAETNLTALFFGGVTHGPKSGTSSTAVTPVSGTKILWGVRIDNSSTLFNGDIGEVLMVSPVIASCIGTNVLNGDCATISGNQKTYYNIAN